MFCKIIKALPFSYFFEHLRFYKIFYLYQTGLLHTLDKGQGHILSQLGSMDTAWYYTGPYSDILETDSDLKWIKFSSTRNM